MNANKPVFKKVGPFTIVITDELIKFKEYNTTLLTVKKNWLKKILNEEC